MPRVASKVGILVAALASIAGAEEPAALSLDEALAFARGHQPQIRSALSEIAARRGDARVPRAGWLPQVGATAQIFYGTANNTTASYLNVPEVDIPRIGGSRAGSGTDWTPQASTLAAISVGQELFDFGRLAAQAAAADALTDVARANADGVALDVQLGVEESFHAVLAGKEVLHATEDAARRAATHRDFAQAGVKSGLRPPIDLTRAQAEVAQLEVRRVRAEAALRSARAALAAAIGSTAPEIDARGDSDGDTGSPAFDEALRRAAEKSPQVAAAVAKLKAQHESARAIGRELLPNLFASATLSGRAGGTLPSSQNAADVPTGRGWLPDVANWDVGVVLHWNIFDATVLARRDAAQAREAVARDDLAAAKMLVGLGTERAWLDLDAATRALPGLSEAVSAAQANQAQADARFKAGLGTVVELADAEALLTNSQLELAIGRFQVARSRAALARAMGEREGKQ